LNSYYIIFVVIILITTAGFWIFFKYRPKKQKKTDFLYTDALNAMLRADKHKAVLLLKNIVKQDSDHVDAYLQLGSILRDDNPQRALKIHQMLTVRPNLENNIRIEIYKALALDYESIGDLKRSKTEAEQILTIDKQNQWALLFLLNLGEKINDWDYAEDKAKRLQKITGNYDEKELVKYLVFRSVEKIKNKEHSAAESLLNDAIKQAPEFGLPYKYLGEIKMVNRDLVKAVEYWEKFVNLSPKDSHKVFDSMESALFDLGRYSEVEKFYRKVLENDLVNVAATLRLANVLNEKGEDQAAIKLIDGLINSGNTKIPILLMKLKLSLSIQTPAELGHQIDKILNQIKNDHE
tara:strand:+ start:19517 stop:20566 length:1050 start_codon:yes stop_codon:yes gene_type:complete